MFKETVKHQEDLLHKVNNIKVEYYSEMFKWPTRLLIHPFLYSRIVNQASEMSGKMIQDVHELYALKIIRSEDVAKDSIEVF